MSNALSTKLRAPARPILARPLLTSRPTAPVAATVRAPLEVSSQAVLRLAREQVNAAEKVLPMGAAWEGFRPFEVSEVIDEAELQRTFVLKPTDGGALADYRPGQYLMFRVGDQVRSYSLSDCAHADRYQVTIKQAPEGKVSSYFHGLAVGATVDVSSPKGMFVFDLDDPTPAVMLGGGVGITPLLAMIKEVARTQSNREVHLYYAVSKSDQLVRREELEAIAAEHPNIKVNFVIGSRLSFDTLKASLPKNHYEFFLCGPPAMMEALTTSLKHHGIAQRFIHTEAFAPAPAKAAPTTVEGPTVKVTFKRSGRVVEWNANQGSLLDAAEAQGVKLGVGCRQGSCGMCSLKCDGGTVSYSATQYIDPGAGNILPCIATPDGDLNLDA